MTPSLAEMVGKHVEISTLAHSVYSGWLTRAEEWAPGEWQLVFGDPRNDDDSLYLPEADIEHVVETAPDRDYREITLGGAKLLVCPDCGALVMDLAAHDFDHSASCCRRHR